MKIHFAHSHCAFASVGLVFFLLNNEADRVVLSVLGSERGTQDQYAKATVGRLCEALIEEGRTDIPVVHKVFERKIHGTILESAV